MVGGATSYVHTYYTYTKYSIHRYIHIYLKYIHTCIYTYGIPGTKYSI